MTTGTSPVRVQAKRLVTGRGRYTADHQFARLAHIAFVRSPYAHALIDAIDTGAARNSPGVIAVFSGADIATVCQPLLVKLQHLPQHRSASQPVLAIDKVVWQGEPLVAVVARSRALAEDAAAQVDITWQPLPALTDARQALAAHAPVIHPSVAKNLAFERIIDEVSGLATSSSGGCVRRQFYFSRQTGVPLESRSVIADYNPADETLKVVQSHQIPHLMQSMYAYHLGIPEHQIEVVCPDIGGGFGTKLHVYADELAVAAISRLLGRPVQYIADRLEAFVADAHAREFSVCADLSATENGELATLNLDIYGALGAYSIYPRSSIGDGVQALTLPAAPYRIARLSGRLQLAYQNKMATGAYRGVGQPIACAITEVLLDDLAHALNTDPLTLRRRCYHDTRAEKITTLGGLQLGELSLHACLDKLEQHIAYGDLRRQQTALRSRHIHRGLGIATFVEQTAIGSALYGPSGAPISSQDYSTVRLTPSGTVQCEVGCTDQGQGTLTGIAQIVAQRLGVSYERVMIKAGNSSGSYGGGAWASRGLSISGEAADKASERLKQRVLKIAAIVLQAPMEQLTIREDMISDRRTGEGRMALAELCRLAYFRQHELPAGVNTTLSVTSSFVPRDPPYFVANGVQASYLEVDIETGMIRLLNHWVVEDCGRIVNPQLVDDQIRGAVVQGLGAALYEQCLYDDDGQLLNGTMADYLVPMAAEMPDIDVLHLQTPQQGTRLGVKGVGEAGTVGALASVWCALNDALRPLGATVERQPFTPAVVLEALTASSN